MALCAQRAARWSGAAAAAAAQQQQAQQAGCVRVRRLSHLDFLLSMVHDSLLSFLSLSPSITAPPPHTQTTKLSKIWFPPVISHSTTQRRRHLDREKRGGGCSGQTTARTATDSCCCSPTNEVKPAKIFAHAMRVRRSLLARPPARPLARPPT